MLIDDFMPTYDIASRHTRLVQASPQKLYPALKALDLRRSTLIVGLFRLRGLPSDALSYGGLERMGFTPLAEQPPHEIVLGLVGQFWRIAGGIVRVPPGEFRDFRQPGYAQAAWNMSLTPLGDRTLLATETRVRCTDGASLRRFRLYWSLIGPFSGLIRTEMLRLASQQALAA